jgi:hypothetical protein
MVAIRAARLVPVVKAVQGLRRALAAQVRLAEPVAKVAQVRLAEPVAKAA